MSSNVDPLIERQREIFLKALEKASPAERAAFLDGACANDAALRAEVELLLKHHTAGSFWKARRSTPGKPDARKASSPKARTQ